MAAFFISKFSDTMAAMNQKELSNSVIDLLIEGYKKFKTEHFEESNLYDELVENGQQPKVLVVACCDSRVDPAIVTNCKPGELFVVRNVANLVPPYDNDPKHHGTSAALEFGVTSLNVSDIIVFGHSHCGGIRALMEQAEHSPNYTFITAWMNIAKAAKQQVLAEHKHESLDLQSHHCEKQSLIISLQNLKTFPWIADRVAKNRLSLHAWYFNLKTGMIETYQSDINAFVPLENQL